jgi:hypothetical protein
MDIFGGWWVNHTETLSAHWLSGIKDTDTIIIPGDISWALKLEEAKADLDWLEAMPGKKVLVKGNHDLWWTSIQKLKDLYESITFIQNSCAVYEDYALCGTRGWLCPGESGFDSHDEKIYRRELGRLELSLKSAKARGLSRIIGILHYPPTNEKLEGSGFTELFEAYGVSKVVYGHLHGEEAFKYGIQGERNGVSYHLVACDYLACEPLKLL